MGRTGGSHCGRCSARTRHDRERSARNAPARKSRAGRRSPRSSGFRRRTGRNRLFEPLHVEEDPRRHPDRGLEQPKEMRPRQAHVGRQKIEIGDLARRRLHALDGLADAEINPLARGEVTEIECGTARQSAKRSMTATISSPRSTSCMSGAVGLLHHGLGKRAGARADVGGDCTDIGGEEVGRVARRPVRPEMTQPLRFDIERKDDCLRPRRVVRIGMRFPRR